MTAVPLANQDNLKCTDATPYPPFTGETAHAKVKAAEDAWNTCNPNVVALAYTED
jgi:nuclear transport factor 2 (NTF2) superfamily protein